MKTALEYLDDFQEDKIILKSFIEEGSSFYHSAQGAMYITDVMIEFAKYHVEKVLKEIKEKEKYFDFESLDSLTEDLYPLENIK